MVASFLCRELSCRRVSGGGARRFSSRYAGGGVGIFLVERLVFEQRGREGIELAAILPQQRDDLLVRLVDDATHFCVEESLGVRRDLGGTRQQRPCAVAGEHGDG